MEVNGSRSFREDFTQLKFQTPATELRALIDEMTVNETCFFREDYQFDCLTRHMLDEVAATKRPGDRVRIWSIPCSTGEEPYSLAIWILENWARADDFDIESHASDVDSRGLERAREGIYEERAVHRVSEALCKEYFARVAGGRFRSSPSCAARSSSRGST